MISYVDASKINACPHALFWVLYIIHAHVRLLIKIAVSCWLFLYTSTGKRVSFQMSSFSEMTAIILKRSIFFCFCFPPPPTMMVYFFSLLYALHVANLIQVIWECGNCAWEPYCGQDSFDDFHVPCFPVIYLVIILAWFIIVTDD